MPNPLSLASMVALAVLVSGCAAGPDFKRPDAPKAGSYTPEPMPGKTASAPVQAGDAQRFDAVKDIPFDWWTLFQSPRINSLIERAFKANPGIKSAQAALRQAQESVIAQKGFFYPTVGANFSPSRTKLSGNTGGNSPGAQGNGHVIQTYSNPGGPAPFNGPVYYNFYTAQLSVGFVPDVFGINGRQVESLEAQANVQKFQLEATYITLASNVVAAALQEASLRAQIDAAKKIVDINGGMLDILRDQFRLGYVTGIDVANQESVFFQAKQSLAPLEKQLEQTRDMIRALAGNLPSEDVQETFELSSLRLPEELPLSLPSKIVEQRPDIRAAEEQLHYASAQVGVAIANRLPQFSITGAWGGNADTPSWMFGPGGGFFSLIGNVSQTIFDGGTLKAREKASDQALIQAKEQYRSTVITAFQNIADTLHAIQSDADALKAAAASGQAAKTALDITRKQYESGYVNYQTLLLADLAYQQSVVNLVQAQTNRFGDTAALYQALGGGWWNRANAQADKVTSSKK